MLFQHLFGQQKRMTTLANNRQNEKRCLVIQCFVAFNQAAKNLSGTWFVSSSRNCETKSFLLFCLLGPRSKPILQVEPSYKY